MTDKEDLGARMARAGKRSGSVPSSTLGVPDPMSREARGDAPVWRSSPATFPRSFTLPLDERRHQALKRLALDFDTSAGVLLRALIDAAGQHAELLDELRPAIRAETAALRKRKG